MKICPLQWFHCFRIKSVSQNQSSSVVRAMPSPPSVCKRGAYGKTSFGGGDLCHVFALWRGRGFQASQFVFRSSLTIKTKYNSDARCDFILGLSKDTPGSCCLEDLNRNSFHIMLIQTPLLFHLRSRELPVFSVPPISYILLCA
jgi:hypothetical protein